MALRPFPGFVGPSYTSESKIATYDRTVNWYPELIESGTGNTGARYVLYPTPGFFTQVTLGDSPGRGAIPNVYSVTGPSSSSIATFVVAGSSLYEYPSTLRASGLSNDTGAPVYMVWNGVQGNQILIAADQTTYCYDTGTHALTTIGTGNSVDFLNGYGLRLDSNANAFYFSAPFDFSTWDALDVVIREDAADNWRRLIVYHNEVWLFGDITTSIYYNGDDTDTPFLPIKSAFMNMGIVAPASACIVAGALMWIGQDVGGNAVVYRANGYNHERISTHAVEYAFQSGTAGLVSLAEGTYRQQNGHDIYQLSLPSQEGGVVGSTWNYDATEGLWFEEGEWNGLQYQELDTRGYFDGLTLSRSSGKVYSVVATYGLGTDGLGIRRQRRAPHINHAQQRTRYTHLRLVMETGLGEGDVPETDPSIDPMMTLSWSNDGGQTFGPGMPVSTGRIGAFSTLVEWRQLEQADDRVFDFVTTSPTPQRLIAAFIDYSVGPS